MKPWSYLKIQRKNIKEVHKELRAWGKFWRAKQLNQGQATSITEKACEVMRKGAFISGVPAGAFGLSDSIHVDERYAAVDRAVEKLSRQCKVALVHKYIIGSKEASGYWIKKAERALLNLI